MLVLGLDWADLSCQWFGITTLNNYRDKTALNELFAETREYFKKKIS